MNLKETFAIFVDVGSFAGSFGRNLIIENRRCRENFWSRLLLHVLKIALKDFIMSE